VYRQTGTGGTMTSGEVVLRALSVEPRSVRAGETVRAVFRARNLGDHTSPAGHVAFAFGEGLEPIEGPDLPIDPVAPGATVTVTVRARAAAPRAERAPVAVCAELHLGDRVLSTNVCTVTVYSRPVLDGPASGTFIETVDAESVRVRAIVTNEGAGPAGALRIVVPTPLGCVRDGGEEPAVLDRERLEAGASAEIAFIARIAEPVTEVCADEGEVRFRDTGRRIGLPVRSSLRAAPLLQPPELALTQSRRGAEIAVTVRNEGWADARGVRVHVVLPPGLKPADGAITVDGMPAGSRAPTRAPGTEPIARVEREREGRTVVLAALAARTCVRLVIPATHRPDCDDGTIHAEIDGAAADIPFVPLRVRELRARLLDLPRTAGAGDEVRLRGRIENTGDLAEDVTFAIETGDELAAQGGRALGPGTAADVTLAVTMPADARDEAAVFRGALVVYDSAGERTRAAFRIPLREPARGSGETELDETALSAPCTELEPGDLAGAAFAVRLVVETMLPATTASAALTPSAPEPVPPGPLGAVCDPVAFTLRLDAARRAEIERLATALRSDGLVGHLFALRLFFPEPCARCDARLAAALRALDETLRDVYDRLFVKLRIPGFIVCADDLEDAALRAAIVAVLQRLDEPVHDGLPPAFENAPLGAPASLRAMVALVPARCDDDPLLGACIAHHAALLDDALSRYEGVPLELFDDALAHRSEPALDEARARLIAALQQAPAAMPIPC
jgi:hypothetical protein